MGTVPVYRISKTFHFSAAHQLNTLPPEHKCSRLHGHNYSVTVVLAADDVDDHGFVRDYGELAEVRKYLDGRLDHNNLSEIFDWPVTAENLAAFLYNVFKPQFPELDEVVVSETPGTMAMYSV